MYLGAIKLTAFALLFAHGLQQLLSLQTWWFIQNVNLVFHEAGHVLSFFLGQFFYVLGGTVFEILVPTTVLLVFIWQRSWFSASCVSWWCMTAWLSVSLYAADAQTRALPLITGDSNSHDWHYLLTQTNLIHLDGFIGGMFWLLGLASLLFGVVLVVQDKHVRTLIRPARTPVVR